MAPRILAAATALALFAAPPAARANDLPPPAQTAGISIPEGQIEKAVEALDGIIESAMRETGVPGLAVAVVRRDEVLFAKGYGVRKAGEEGAVDTDTVFQLASLSKPVGATVVAKQVGEGIVDWDTRMSEILPWFKLSNPESTALLTVGDLYAHRSGLPDHAGDDLEDLVLPLVVLRGLALEGGRTEVLGRVERVEGVEGLERVGRVDRAVLLARLDAVGDVDQHVLVDAKTCKKPCTTLLNLLSCCSWEMCDM